MYQIKISNKYKTDFKRIHNDNFIIDELIIIINLLQKDEVLPEKYKDHQLKGKLSEFRECHIKPDLLLIYKKNKILNILTLTRIGNHNTLFLS
jgi:mRNA interferase YafQ